MCSVCMAATSRAMWLERLDRPIQTHLAPAPAGHRGHAMRSVGSSPRHISPQALHSVHALLIATLLRREVVPIAPMFFALCWISSPETQLGGRIGRGGARAPAKPEARLSERPLRRRARMRQPGPLARNLTETRCSFRFAPRSRHGKALASYLEADIADLLVPFWWKHGLPSIQHLKEPWRCGPASDCGISNGHC